MKYQLKYEKSRQEDRNERHEVLITSSDFNGGFLYFAFILYFIPRTTYKI